MTISFTDNFLKSFVEIDLDLINFRLSKRTSISTITSDAAYLFLLSQSSNKEAYYNNILQEKKQHFIIGFRYSNKELVKEKIMILFFKETDKEIMLLNRVEIRNIDSAKDIYGIVNKADNVYLETIKAYVYEFM